MKMQDIKREHTKSGPIATHDWRKEPWFQEDAASDLEMHISLCLATALNAKYEDSQEGEDEMVFAILRPDAMERIWKSDLGHDHCRFRVAHAISQCISGLRMEWIKRYGNAEAKGSPTPAAQGDGG